MRYAKNMRLLGYWLDVDDDATINYPEPQDLVDDSWLEGERELLASYLNPKQNTLGEWGFSWCRFECGITDEEMGSLAFTDGVWIWPQGLAHYIVEHGVTLPDVFVDHARSNGWKVPDYNESWNTRDIDPSIWIEWSKTKKA